MDAHDLRATLLARGIGPSVGDLVCSVPRDRFLPPSLRQQAWRDCALPLSQGQTISQPTVVAVMTQAAGVGAGDRVLDVGTGSGYQAAVLAASGAQVLSIERIPELARRARATLAALGIPVEVRCADGSLGAPDQAPFDAIVVAAATPAVPPALLDQLRPATEGRRGGRLVLPLASQGPGFSNQELVVLERTEQEIQRRHLLDVLFVPLVTGPV